MPSASGTLSPASKSFVQNLNLLLKFARLYGLGHARTKAQFKVSWSELRLALTSQGPAGLILGTSGGGLLLDGVPLESTPAERSLSELLNTANISSIVFAQDLKKDAFGLFVRIFSESSFHSSELIGQLQSAFGEGMASGIQVNEIRYVPAAPARAAKSSAAQTASSPLVRERNKTQDWYQDPSKLSELIAAAQTAERQKGMGFDFGEELVGPAAHSAAQPKAVYALSEGEMQKLMHMVSRLGSTARRAGNQFGETEWKAHATLLPRAAQAMLHDALANRAAGHPMKRLDDAALLRLAEDLALDYAVERFEHGNLKANAVRQLLDTLGSEVRTLRGVPDANEERPAKPDPASESHLDSLDRLFWTLVPEADKRRVLLSPHAWCVPTRAIQPYVEELLAREDGATVQKILVEYAGCLACGDAETRKKTAQGLSQLAFLYSRAASTHLDEVLRLVGDQLADEGNAEFEGLLGAAFVRFGQESTERRAFPAIRQALDSLTSIEKVKPRLSRELRPRIGVNNRIPIFIEQGIKSDFSRPEIVEVLRRVPQASAEQLANRLMHVTRGSEREQIVELAQAIGEPAKQHLRQTLEDAPAAQAMHVVGLMSRLEPSTVQATLPDKILAGDRNTHDEILRQLSVAGAPERGRILFGALDRLDSMIVPMALDEIGMSGDTNLVPELLSLAEGESMPRGSDFIRVKAVEALGRLRAPEAADQLRHFVEARRAWRWAYPAEIRLAAAQALLKLDPLQAQSLFPSSGLDSRMVAFAPLDARPDRDYVRYRRYPRIPMTRPVPAVIESQRAKYQPAVNVLSLEGGLLSGNLRLPVGTPADLRISSGRRPIHLSVLVRFSRANQAGVEMVGMALEDRSRLRNLLVSMAGAAAGISQPLAAPA